MRGSGERYTEYATKTSSPDIPSIIGYNALVYDILEFEEEKLRSSRARLPRHMDKRNMTALEIALELPPPIKETSNLPGVFASSTIRS